MTNWLRPPPEYPYMAVCAGEASGDMIGGAVLAHLLPQLGPAWHAWGVGGEHLQQAGLQLAHGYHTLAVRGYVEVVSHLPAIIRLRRALLAQWRTKPPAAFLGVDAPDFNLGVARQLKAIGVPTMHLVSPSIWAWRGGRIHGIKQAVDLMLCLFPFEPTIYHKVGMQAVFVGHPLAEQVPLEIDQNAARTVLGLSGTTAPIIAVLPGSRTSEIHHLADVFFNAMHQLAQRYAGCQFVIPVAHPQLRPMLETLQARHDYANDIHLLNGQAQSALAAADVVLVASGTATLETALFKKPMVIAYKVPWLTAQIMKRQGYLPYVGLPNILLGEFVVPEYLQHHCTPESLTAAIADWLDHPAKMNHLKSRFTDLHHQLRLPTGQRAAEAIVAALK